jgi:predicted Zn-dependent protease
MDVNNDGCVELPFVSDPTTLPTCDPAAPSAAYPQATIQQATQSIVTHELAHALGVNLHTTDATCVMYQYSINWIRDGHFSPTAANLIQVVNKGGL